MIDELLPRLENWLEENRPDFFGNLQDGVSEASLDAFETKFSVNLPDSFRQLYRWRNGQDRLHLSSFQDNLMFLSREEITNAKSLLDEMIGVDFDDPDWWRKDWVPFLGNGGGDHLCLDLGGFDDGTPGQVIDFWHDDGHAHDMSSHFSHGILLF